MQPAGAALLRIAWAAPGHAARRAEPGQYRDGTVLVRPGSGRRARPCSARRAVQGTDVSLDGRLRLDAHGPVPAGGGRGRPGRRGWHETYDWVVRRCAVRRATATRGSASGCGCGRSARRSGPGGPSAPRRWPQATATASWCGPRAVWAAVDSGSGRPCPLGPEFLRVYGPSAAGRTVSARLSHPRPPEQADGGTLAAAGGGLRRLRAREQRGVLGRGRGRGGRARLAARPSPKSSTTVPPCPAANPGCSRRRRPARPGPGC